MLSFLSRVAVVCILACHVDGFRLTHAIADRRKAKTDLQGKDVLSVRVNVAELPPGRKKSGRKEPKPKVEFRLANRHYATDPDFLAQNARLRIPLEPGDGSLYVTLYDGKTNLGTVSELLRTKIFPYPGEWLSFHETLKKANGELQFDVFYEKSDQALEGTGNRIVDADYRPIDTNVAVENVSSPTLFEVCQMLQRTSYDDSHSDCFRKKGDEVDDSSLYFLCNPTTNSMEVCFFKRGVTEFQQCRMSSPKLSLATTHVESNGDFAIPLVVQMKSGALVVESKMKGAVSGSGIKDNTLLFQTPRQQYEYISNPSVTTITTTTTTTTTTNAIADDCDSCSGSVLCSVCRFYVGGDVFVKAKWDST